MFQPYSCRTVIRLHPPKPELRISFRAFPPTFRSSLFAVVSFRCKQFHHRIRQLIGPDFSAFHNIGPGTQFFIVIIENNRIRRSATVIDRHIHMPSFGHNAARIALRHFFVELIEYFFCDLEQMIGLYPTVFTEISSALTIKAGLPPRTIFEKHRILLRVIHQNTTGPDRKLRLI